MANPAICGACCELMPTDGRYMKCCDCSSLYHLGKKCSGVADGTFKGMSAAKLEKWRCLTCREGQAKANLNTDSPFSQAEPPGFLEQLSAVHQKLDLLLSLKDAVDNLQEMHPKIDALLAMKLTVDTMRNTMDEMQTSLNFLSSQYDSLVKSTKAQDKVVKELQTETKALRSLLSDQALEIQQLKAVQNDTDQSNRTSNLEIHGIPFLPHENLGGILTNLAGQLSIQGFQPTHVEAVHRLPARRDAVPPILVRFSSAPLKERWMMSRSRLSSLPFGDSQPRVYFNDNLTDSNKKLFWMARTRGKEKGYKFVWVRHGQIFAKQNEGSTLLRIINAAALEQIV